jgi:hypothetical protein
LASNQRDYLEAQVPKMLALFGNGAVRSRRDLNDEFSRDIAIFFS